jgi:hypothetical protein
MKLIGKVPEAALGVQAKPELNKHESTRSRYPMDRLSVDAGLPSLPPLDCQESEVHSMGISEGRCIEIDRSRQTVT